MSKLKHTVFISAPKELIYDFLVNGSKSKNFTSSIEQIMGFKGDIVEIHSFDKDLVQIKHNSSFSAGRVLGDCLWTYQLQRIDFRTTCVIITVEWSRWNFLLGIRNARLQAANAVVNRVQVFEALSWRRNFQSQSQNEIE